jgi:hypothetical protein
MAHSLLLCIEVARYKDMPNGGIGTRARPVLRLCWCDQHLSNVREHGSNKNGSAVP